MNKQELNDRLIEFSVSIIEITNQIPASKAGNHLSGQLVRAGTSVALNYGEAQSGESKKDFIHKVLIVLKELRETLICLKILWRAKLFADEGAAVRIINENNELISIFVRTVETARRNMRGGV